MAIVIQAIIILTFYCGGYATLRKSHSISVVSQPGEDECLSCPRMYDSSAGLSWWFGNKTEIFRSDGRIGNGWIDIDRPIQSITISNCSRNYSLLIQNISTSDHGTKYSCRAMNMSLAVFQIRIEVPAMVVIERLEGINGKIKCLIYNIIQPFNVTWLVNGIVHEAYLFSDEVRTVQNFTSTTELEDVKHVVNISCQVNGPYVKDTIYSTSIDDRPSPSPQNDLPVLFALVPVLFSISIATSFILYFRRMRQDKLRWKNIRLELKSVSVPECNAHVRASVYPYEDINDNDYSEREGASHREEPEHLPSTDDDRMPSLLICLKTTRLFQYWSAQYKNEAGEEIRCFAKSLSGSATLEEANEFQEMAKKLRSLNNNFSLVKIVDISVTKTSRVIFYEHMDFGSLRDFLMSRYQEARKSRALSRVSLINDSGHATMKNQLQDLLFFASSITKGMVFITSHKFRHPALRIKKVLLTQVGHCKLYDICPEEKAVSRIHQHMKKARPPIAWMSPEAIFLNQYTSASDVWGLAVSLWEIFSFGELPLAREDSKEIERQMEEDFTLRRPWFCPEQIYSLMKSCWTNTQKERPTVKQILKQINATFDHLQKTPPVLENQAANYFVLERGEQCNDDVQV